MHLKMKMVWFGRFVTKNVDAFAVLAEDGGYCTVPPSMVRKDLSWERSSPPLTFPLGPTSDTETCKTSPLSFSSGEIGNVQALNRAMNPC